MNGRYSGRTPGRQRFAFGAVRDRMFNDPRLQRVIEQVHRAGPRPVGELIVELLEAAGDNPDLLDRILDWSQLDPRLVRALGADRFPPWPPYPVPPRERGR